MITAPMFRRLLLLIASLVLLSLLLWAKTMALWFKEQAPWASLRLAVDVSTEGVVGSDPPLKLPGMTQVENLDPALLPGAEAGKRRLIFVGDIHGCRNDLQSLLDKLEFNEQTDHLVAVGDIVNKGPDSPGVIDLLQGIKASCVRGNHEDRLLLLADHIDDNPPSIDQKGRGKKALSDLKAEKHLVRAFSQSQLSYLRSLPLVLHIGFVKGIGDIVVVHAGLVPGLPIGNQDPFSIMNMRIIDLKSHSPSKKHYLENHVPWTQLWNRFQHQLPSESEPQMPADAVVNRRTTVVYGHDSKRGLQIDEYTKGLDSGCVEGGKLSALVVSEGGDQQIVQVDCQESSIKNAEDNDFTGSPTSVSD